jgi:DNA-binding winged helix-turn-helix (wHTH) protein/predicted ATPase
MPLSVENSYCFQRFTLDLWRGSLRSGSEDIQMRPKSFELLRYLVENAGRLVSKDELMKAIWPRVVVTDESLARCVSDVRQVLGDSDQRIIRTVPRRGYIFEAVVSGAPAPPREADQARFLPPPAPGSATSGLAEETRFPAIVESSTLPEDPTRLPLESHPAERRHLTVMTVKLFAAASQSARLDAEELHRELAACHERCRKIIERCHGHIARYGDEGLIAYFGYPETREHVAEHAVRAALMLVATEATSASLQLGIGMASGIVVVGERLAVGKTIDLARHLRDVAKAGSVVIAQSTRQLLGRLFEYRDLANVVLENLTEPLRAYEVLRARPVECRFETRCEFGLEPIVGRADELDLLQRRWRQAREGDGRVVLISGEPGIGKSRLVAALEDLLAADTYTRLGYFCSPHHTDSTLFPLIGQLERAAGIKRNETPGQKFDKLVSLLEPCSHDDQIDVALLADLLSLPTDSRYRIPDMSAQKRKERTLAALLTQVERLALQQPVLLIYEDVHWADPTSRELLDLLIDRSAGLRVLLVLTFRTEFQAPWVGQSHVTSLTLTRLAQRAGIALVEHVAGNKALPDDVSTEIFARADGIPLFIEELTKALLETGVLDQTGRVVPGRSLFDWGIPATLHASLMARHDRLSPTAKKVAQIAAVIGREFAYDLLAEVANIDDANLRSALAVLGDTGLVLSRGTPPHATFRFRHALFQDAVHGTLLRDLRRDLHARVVTALETHYPDVVATQPELLARHCAAAELTEEALSYRLKAGQRAAETSAFVEANTHLQIALELLQKMPPGRQQDERELQLQQLRGGALIATRGFAAVETINTFKRAFDLCREFGDSPQVFSVLSGIIAFHVARGEVEQSRDIAEDLLERASRQDDRTAKLIGHRAFGMSLFLMGALSDSRDHLQKALELYDVARHGPLAPVFSQDLKAGALSYRAFASILLGDPAGGLRHARAAVEHSEKLRHPHSICYALTFLAGAHAICGDPEAARQIADRAIALADEYAFAQWLAGGCMIRGWARVRLGQVEGGLSEGRRSIESLQATGALVWVQFARFFLAQSLAQANYSDEALAIVDQLLTEGAATSGRWYDADLHRLKGDLLLARAEALQAERCYERAIAIASRQEARHWQSRAEAALASLRRSQATALRTRSDAPLLSADTDTAPQQRAPAKVDIP